MKRFWQKNKGACFLVLGSLLVAVLSHLYFILEWVDGRYMTGIGDGMSQMLPFKQMLYDGYREGNFFYSDRFGMGGGTYSQLGYYFSTSIIFILTSLVTFMLEALALIGKADLFYWANAIIPISIIRMTLIIIVTTLYFRYMKLKGLPAFVGAVVYGTSIIYFRHVTYWEFFADAMLWLPILLYGVEKVIGEKKVGLFTIAIAINMFDNFYFAYINFLLALIYIVFRWFISLGQDEAKIWQQIKLYLIGGLIGFGMSAVAFIPAVYGYFNNHRIPYEAAIRLIGTTDNPLIDGRIIVVPAIVILCLFVSPFYKDKLFKFFAGLTIFSILIHFSPIVASVFNGFSAPQYRWEYFLALVAGGVVAVALEKLAQIEARNVLLALTATLVLYLLAYLVDPSLPFKNWQAAYLVYAALATFILFVSLIWKRGRNTGIIFAVFIIGVSLFTSNFFQAVKLSDLGDVRKSSYEWMHSEAYIGDEQTELINKIKEREQDAFYRIDWFVPTRNNTPIVQEFNGFSAYSSILNKELLYFYLYDLEIDMGRESVSRYGTLGNRANLASILAGKYFIAEKNEANIPYGFAPVFATENYVAYENKHVLPFVRATDKVYLEADFEDQVPLVREQAMIDGLILKEALGAVAEPPASDGIRRDFTVTHVDAVFSDGILEVTDRIGGLDLDLLDVDSGDRDYYISFELKRLEMNKQFNLHVNEYKTLRKKNSSIYKTGVDKLTIRIAASDTVSIRLPKGKYELRDLAVYAENYQTLHAAQATQEHTPFSWENNRVNLNYENLSGERYIVLPIPFEKGWNLSVNGKKSEVLEANYGFIGIGLEDGVNEIKLIYHPPYFFPALLISALSLLGGICIIRREVL